MNDIEQEIFQKTFVELYTINTLINVTKNVCKEHEFKGEYYGSPNSVVIKLSAERNDYINMLEIVNDKINQLMDNYLIIENEMTL